MRALFIARGATHWNPRGGRKLNRRGTTPLNPRNDMGTREAAL